MFDVDKKKLLKSLGGAIQRVSRVAAQATLAATKDELQKTRGSLEGALDRITASATHAIAKSLKDEFAKLEDDTKAVKDLLR